MVLIKGGPMFMGDLNIESAAPPHKVTVASFCIDRTEVTAGAYDACAKSGTRTIRAPNRTFDFRT